MRGTIDGAGRLVVPKQLRERLGLRGGDAVEIEDMGDHLEIRPMHPPVRIVDQDDGPVIVADEGAEPLTVEDVRRLIDETRG